MILSACSDGGDAASTETPVSASTESQTPDGSDGDSTTEPEASQPDGRRIGGEAFGFTVELPEGWLNVPTDDDEIDALAEQEDIPEDVAMSMHRVVFDSKGVDTLVAYGGTEDDVDIFLIASCAPDDGSVDGSETGSATVDGIPAARTSDRDSNGQRVWLSYRFPVGDELCWIRFPAPDESWFAQFDDIVATIDVF